MLTSSLGCGPLDKRDVSSMHFAGLTLGLPERTVQFTCSSTRVLVLVLRAQEIRATVVVNSAVNSNSGDVDQQEQSSVISYLFLSSPLSVVASFVFPSENPATFQTPLD